jgi:hypothetical protein
MCGIGLHKMEVLQKNIWNQEGEYINFIRYYLKHRRNFTVHAVAPDDHIFFNYWLTAILIDPLILSVTRDQVMQALRNIESRFGNRCI